MQGQCEKRPVTVADIIEVAGIQSTIVVDEGSNVLADHYTTQKGWEMVSTFKVLSIFPIVKYKGGSFAEVFIQVTVDYKS